MVAAIHSSVPPSVLVAAGSVPGTDPAYAGGAARRASILAVAVVGMLAIAASSGWLAHFMLRLAESSDGGAVASLAMAANMREGAPRVGAADISPPATPPDMNAAAETTPAEASLPTSVDAPQAAAKRPRKLSGKSIKLLAAAHKKRPAPAEPEQLALAPPEELPPAVIFTPVTPYVLTPRVAN